MTWSWTSPRRRAAVAPTGSGADTKAASLWTELHEPAELDAQRAREAAQRARAEAEARHRQALEDAYRRGLEEGTRTGEQRARHELSSSVAAVEAALEGVAAAEERHAADLRDNLVSLAVAVARRVVDRELESSPEIVGDIVEGAIATFPPDQGLKIRVHTQDLALIKAAGGDAGRSSPLSGRDIRWVGDDAVTRGGCVVEGPDRVVDGRVDRALERLYWALNDA